MLRNVFLALSVTTALCAPHIVRAEMIADSVSQALMTHPDIKAGQVSVSVAGENVREQRSSFFPVIGIDGSAGRVRNNDDTTRGATADQGAAASWMGQGTIRLTQPIFAGYGNVNRLEGARERASAAGFDLNGTAEDISLRAARAHLNLMRTKELLGLAAKFQADILARRDNIAMMVKEGAADQGELLQADEIKMVAQNTKLGYEESYRQAVADYIEVVGAQPTATLDIGEPVWNGLIPASIDEAVQYARSKNAHVMAAHSMVSALGSEAEAEVASLIPHVDAEMSYTQKDQDDALGGELSSAQALLKMGWNFSMGGAQAARIDRTRLQKKEALARLQGVQRGVERDVRQKYASMEIVDQQFALLAEREKSSQGILDNFLAQYEGGKQSNLQLIAAQSKMFEAGAARTDAHYRRILSRLELLNAMGRLHEAFGTVKIGAK